MKKWISPKMVDLGIEDTKACRKDHTGQGGAFTLDSKSDSSDSSKDGASSCSSDCPFDQES